MKNTIDIDNFLLEAYYPSLSEVKSFVRKAISTVSSKAKPEMTDSITQVLKSLEEMEKETNGEKPRKTNTIIDSFLSRININPFDEAGGAKIKKVLTLEDNTKIIEELPALKNFIQIEEK